MITRTQMPRQLRNKGGITSVVPRTNYLLGGIKKRIRKLIPNELADVAVKAAPFVAMIPGYGPATAALMRGIGRFDQRGSLSDAFKQGLGTFAGGKLFGAGMEKIGLRDPGAKGIGEFFSKGTRSKAGSLFEGGEKITTVGKQKSGPLANVAEKAFEAAKIPFSDKIPTKVKEKLLVGGITSGASALYSYFMGEFEPQEPGESLEEYMARRRESVKLQTRQFMDSYYTPLRNPEYAAMSDEQKDNFIDGIVGQGMATGGRVGYQTGGITMANTLAENIRRNLANQAAINQQLEQARKNIPVQQSAQVMDPTRMIPQTSTLNPNLEQAIKNAEAAGRNKEYIDTMLRERQDSDAIDFFKDLTPTPTPAQTSAPNVQETIPEMMPPLTPFGPGPNMIDPLQLFSGLNALQLSELPEQDYLDLAKRFDDLPQAEKDKLDKRVNTMLDQQAEQFLANEKKFGSFADGRYVDPGLGRSIYQNILKDLEMNYPNEFAKLTGNETLAELDQKLVDLSPFMASSPTSPRTTQQDSLGQISRPSTESLTMAFNPAARSQARSQLFGGPPSGMNQGGRVSLEEGGTGFMKWLKANYGLEVKDLDLEQYVKLSREFNNENPDPEETGRKKNAMGSMPVGIMRTNKAGVMERDYRDKGGFVPVGIKEKADDVPAMLSKNEFVFTADAVRGAGNGSIEKGAQRMYDTMKKLEKRVV